MADQWFISDLHLATERPETLQLFEAFVTETPRGGDRLFILGDLFDAWIGDDDDAMLASRVRDCLRGTSDRGVSIRVQRGNRDFLMGRRLMRDCGAQLLPDCHVCDVAGQRTLLMHGDLLCTDDVAYMKARRKLRNPVFQWVMLRRSLAARRGIATEYRRRSQRETSLKAADIMDVNEETVLRYFARYRVRQLIHGHTHRPATHEYQLADGRRATRLVLPEWHADHAVAWRDDGSALAPVTVTRPCPLPHSPR